MAYKHSPKEPIAIIGSGCRFPGDSTTPSKLWDLLRTPRDLTKEVPKESRFNAEGFYHPNGERHGCSNVTKSYFIEEDPRFFDCGFFSIAPREAEAIDPQQRLLLETVYEAMENAGLTLQDMKGSQTSAYVGAMSADYTDTQTRDIENMSQYMITGTSRALLSNRLSYFFDWHGPSISVDTACSSSLAAVHLGVQSLRNGECTASCVAGSNLIMGPDAYLAATSLHLLSPSGRSQMWDKGADGYARGEGICAFFMKTLSQALKDGDRIDGLIRETCVNSDGRTVGIALPSAEAQAALASTAYRNAGLDILRAEDRPQYIEAHGTGTQAGDPREASALSRTFFPPGLEHEDRPSLYVGSIKTVIGHTEGTAGIAGMIKVLLAMRHKTIPPNLHLHNLNPSVKPSYQKLRVPSTTQKWPEVSPTTPMRASVNGFGSGGTNCHAILESYVPEIHDHGPWGRQETKSRSNGDIPASLPQALESDFSPAPLVFSAASETALVAMLERYTNYLEAKTDVSIHQVAQTLKSHRSILPVRVSFAGGTRQNLLEAINKQLALVRGSPGTEIGIRPPAIELNESRGPRILGVFTGQGAQWPGMGQTLMKTCALFRETIEMMELSLGELPGPDRPSWSLAEELMAPPATSRMADAELSLPLCAAVQVGLTRVLTQAGITFHTVVGHSGGEIGAAYAAGKISEVDAIKIAYYRGIVCKLAVGSDGKRGGMIAVGFGYEDGLSFCSTPQMEGRITVACSNSPKSVTLAGDKDAVIEAKQMLDEQGLFNRLLQVDTGYHSAHMQHCAVPYTAQLTSCNLLAGQGNGETAWVSSVYSDNRTITPADDVDLQTTYWTDNLIGRVLFSQALERALNDGRGSIDLILEVGPHAALKAPTLDTMRAQVGYEVPYAGALDRKADDVTALGRALGLVWTHLGPTAVDFKGYATAFAGKGARFDNTSPLFDLPTYPWDHKQILFRESRLNYKIRSRTDRPHELIGSRTPDDTDYEPRWRNLLKLEEMPWLRDHRIQNQIIVPAATYCVMALEAARTICRGKPVEAIQLCNMSILRPIVLDESSGGTETLLSLRTDLDSTKGKTEVIRAEFTLSSGTIEDKQLRTAATGEIRIILGGGDNESDFSKFKPQDSNDLVPVSVKQLYESLGELGLGYSGPFRAIKSVKRRMNSASAVVAIDEEVAKSVPIHPTWLDACFQTFLAAFAAPRDGSMWTAFMPTTIGRMTFSPTSSVVDSVAVDAQITEFVPGFQTTLPTMNGDMSIYNASTGQLQVRIEDFTMSSFLPATEKDDKRLYMKTVWQRDILSGATWNEEPPTSYQDDVQAIDACEKAICYILSKIKSSHSIFEALSQRIPGFTGLMDTLAAHHTANVPTFSELKALFDEFEGKVVDLALIRLIGTSLLAASSPGLIPASSQPPPSPAELMTRWHDEGLGFSQVHHLMISAAKQISHRHSSLKILQIGPSAAHLPRSILQELHLAVESYTLVDASAGALESIKSHLSPDHQLRINFQVVDVENDVEALEGLSPFDLVIVHKAFRKQKGTLKSIRNLTKPGGFLLMMAATGDSLRFPFFLLAAPPKVNEDDPSQPPVITNSTRKETHGILQGSGFSGVDSVGFDNSREKHTFSVVVSQAVDDQVSFLRVPLSSTPPELLLRSGKLLIVGGSSSKISNLVARIQSTLTSVWGGEIVNVKSFADLTSQEVSDAEAVLNLAELDQSVLQDLSAAVFNNLRTLLEGSKALLWILRGARSDNPYHSGTIGLGRTFLSENPHKTLQFLDLDTVEEGYELLIAESLLRLVAGVAMKENGGAKQPHLWTVEPELAVEKGKLAIPRIFLDKERNDRLNSFRRKIETQAPANARPVAITRSQQRNAGQAVYTAEEVIRPSQASVGKVRLTVDYSSTEPVIPSHTRDQQLFCCLGHTDNGAQVLTLSSSNASIVIVPCEQTIQLDNDTLTVSEFAHIVNEIRSLIVEKAMPIGHTTLLCGSNAADLATHLERRGKKSDRDFAVIQINQHASKKQLKSLIPPRARLVIHQGLESDNTGKISTFQQILPSYVAVTSFNDLIGDGVAPLEVLSEALAYLKKSSSPPQSLSTFDASKVVKASTLVMPDGAKSHGAVAATVVDWTGDQSITLTPRPVNAGEFLSPNKTYILAGLSGQVGQSICRWMVEHGARHIVVTSRNPNKNPLWKKELEAQGATVAIEAADITNKQDVVDLRRRILTNMPPICGVANGAMVMGNSFFSEMTFETWQKVMRPKVDGSLVLDEVFSQDDLDFFLLFSSISAVTGQRGQANYAAANNFMVGLAAQRRSRNLAASVVDIGMIIGIGFIQRTNGDEDDNALTDLLRVLDYMPLSERELHQVLAEAILVGKSSGESSEILTGLETNSNTSGHNPFWHKSLLFTHVIKNTGSANAGFVNSVEQSLKEKLADAHGPDDALAIMEGALLQYLASSLKLSADSIHTDVPVIDLGIDSLIAVEIRNWVFAETDQDIPVLKILGVYSVRKICKEVVSSLSFNKDRAKSTETKIVQATTAAPPKSRDSNKQTEEEVPVPLSENSPPDDISNSSDQPPQSDSIEDGGDQSTVPSTILSTPATLDVGNEKPSFRSDLKPTRTEALSLGQSRLYFLSQYLDDETDLNCTISYELTGKLDMARLERSLDAVIQSHETLRTIFLTNEEDGKAMQSVLASSSFRLRVVPGTSGKAQVKEVFDRTHSYHYNLITGDTFVATVLTHGLDSHTIVFGYHHIIMDGVSWQICQRDLAKFYNDPSASSSTSLAAPAQYVDYSRNQQRSLSSGEYAERLEFFQGVFNNKPVDTLPLFPFAKVSTRKSLTRYATRDVVTHVGADLVSALKKASQASRATSSHFFLSAYQVLLHRLLGINQMCIGVVDANRSDQSYSQAVGFFLETLPVLFNVNGESKFNDVLQTTRGKVYAALGHSGVPTEEILRACNVPASTTETPLFQACFNFRMGAGRTHDMQGVNIKFLEYADAKNPFDLVITVDELDNGEAMLTFALQDYLYSQESAELLAHTYIHLLEVLSKDPTAAIGTVPVFDTTLQQQAVTLGTGPTMDSTASVSVDTLSKAISTWAEKDPGALAAKDLAGNSKTYAQLSERASSIVTTLVSVGVGTSSPIVGVLLEPGVDTIATILAILQLGATYVPLDTRNGDETLTDILIESGISVSGTLLFQPATAERASQLARNANAHQQVRLVSLDDVPLPQAEAATTGIVAHDDASTPDTTAMILYTSGSTGKPKGIPLTNANLWATILGASERAQLGREVVLQQSGQGFDAAIFQIFIALVNGGTLIMGNNRDHPTDLATLMKREGVTCTVFVASEMQSMLNYGLEELQSCVSWRVAMVAGEAFTKTLLDQFRSLNRRHDIRIWNAYGPTEASICSSMHEISSTDDTSANDIALPIGKALTNYGTYIVDEECNPVSVGWPGQIAIAGPGVTSGYLGLPELTESKFKKATSALLMTAVTDRLYLTGDKGMMLSDGSIVMLGRIDGDDQVKIRGMRVQLGDVSRALVQASRGNLAGAEVLLRHHGDDSSQQQLIAYVIFASCANQQIVDDKQTYLRRLSQELPLPTYMRPAMLIPLDAFPTTERGKLDRRMLAAMDLPEAAVSSSVHEDAEDLTEHEKRLRDVWKNVLGDVASSIISIRRNSEFFSVGGNSLLLLPLKAEICREFGVDLSLPELFHISTLELQAARLLGDFKRELEQIDWDKETELDETFFAATAAVTPPPPRRNGVNGHTNGHSNGDTNGHSTTASTSKSNGISVLITGATGFLGSAILRQLVDLPQVARIHCVAIRASASAQDDEPQRRLGVDSDKIVSHAGDLTLPNFGMTQQKIDTLIADVDVILHNGAEVSHMKNYRSLRAANFLSTIQLGRLAVRRGIPIHYVSTGGVARLSGAKSQPESSLAAFRPPLDGSDGYVASKWASEVVLEKISERFQALVWIHRPSSVTADNVPALDIVHSLTRFSKTIKAVPDLTGSTGSFDFIHVDTISKEIAACVVANASGEKKGHPVYIHQSGQKVVPVNELKEFLEGLDHLEGSDLPYKILPLQEWVSEAIANGLDEVVGSFMLASGGVIQMPLLERSHKI